MYMNKMCVLDKVQIIKKCSTAQILERRSNRFLEGHWFNPHYWGLRKIPIPKFMYIFVHYFRR